MISYLHVDNVVVAVVADLNVLKGELGQYPLPGLPVDEGRRVHNATVGNDENILPALFGHGEVGVLQRHHGRDEVLLEV